MNTYMLGTSVKVSAVFADEVGEVFDPAATTCRIKRPDASETIYTFGVDAQLVKDSVGHYHLWVQTTMAGRYAYRFKGVDDQAVADETVFAVYASDFAIP